MVEKREEVCFKIKFLCCSNWWYHYDRLTQIIYHEDSLHHCAHSTHSNYKRIMQCNRFSAWLFLSHKLT